MKPFSTDIMVFYITFTISPVTGSPYTEARVLPDGQLIFGAILKRVSTWAAHWVACHKLHTTTDLHTQIRNATRLGERRADRFCYANEHISVHCPSFGSLPMCPDRLRLPSWLTIPAETGLGQLSQGSRYGSHHAPFHAFLETSWRIANETLSTL